MRGAILLSAVLFPALAPWIAARAEAAGLLDPIFGDHAVLPRDTPIGVWGRAPAGAAVNVMLEPAAGAGGTVPAGGRGAGAGAGGPGREARAAADASGRWSVSLAPLAAGGPYTLTAQTAAESQSSGDVLVGDVFLCSGQSNMELPVLRAADSAAEIQHAANDSIRMLTVPHDAGATPLARLAQPVPWEVASPVTVPGWSAVCFFYARELQKSIHVPIGLVSSTWSGANIRPWISAAALHADGGYEDALATLSIYASDPAAGQRRLAERWESWWRAESGDAPGTEPWSARADPERAAGRAGGPRTAGASPSARPAQSSSWHAVPVELRNWREWGVPELADFNGLLWFRTTFELTPAQAKRAGTLKLGPINQVDESWLDGRALGNTFGYETGRSYAIPAGALRAGKNVLVVNVLSTYGGGGLLADGEPRALLLDDGESVALTGPWQYRVVPAAYGDPPRAPWESVGGLTTLYNAMIAPLGPFPFRAALWYQGESNTAEAGSYGKLLAELRADWRRQFGPNLVFLVVQLPNFGAPSPVPSESGWSDVREAERKVAAADARSGLAVTIDIGDAHNLHPANKQDVGRRLARAARRALYGESLAPAGPAVRRALERGGGIALDFGDIEGQLVTYSHEEPIGFELCGASAGTCRFVDARIEGRSVILAGAGGLVPTRVRYCWGDSPICTLYDSNGLPAGPFEIEIQRAP
jgi:sialate O-acetylesterase